MLGVSTCQVENIEMEVYRHPGQIQWRYDTSPRIIHGLIVGHGGSDLTLEAAQREALRLLREKCQDIIRSTER